MSTSPQDPPDAAFRFYLAADRVVTATGAEIAPGWIEVAGGKVVSVGAGRPDGDVVESVSGTIVPGFVDMHAHGALGHDFVSATDEGIDAIRQHHAQRGTTTLIATVATAPLDTMVERVSFLRPYVESGLLAGVHLEGPYLSHERRGAHDPGLLRHPEAAEVEELISEAAGTLRMITLAPELPGSPEAIELFVAAGVAVAIGHTACTAEQATAAVDAGATVLTHAYNGMPPLHHREAGPLGVALVDDRVTVELILDGHHVGYEATELVRRIAQGRLALVSDAMAATGLGDGSYRVAGSPVTVRNGVATLANGTSLAGSTITVADGFARLREAHGASWGEVVAATSETPASAVGITASGLRTGDSADLVVVNEHQVAGVMRAGNWVVEPPRA